MGRVHVGGGEEKKEGKEKGGKPREKEGKES